MMLTRFFPLNLLCVAALLGPAAQMRQGNSFAGMLHANTSEEILMAELDGTGAGKQQAGLPEVPEMIASTDRPFSIGPEASRITLQIHEPTGPARHKVPKDQALFLRIENYTCDKSAPSFAVFLNVPPGQNPQERDDLYAGSMGTFGLPEASSKQGEHGGAGKSVTLNLTRLHGNMLEQKLWDQRRVTIVFMPEQWDAPVPQVNVGRVSLYLQ